MATTRNPFDVLGVAHNETCANNIKAAFHRALKANHPDLHPGSASAEEATKAIIEAYGILTDPVRLSAWKSGSTHSTAETRKADASTTAYASKYVRTASPEIQAQTDALIKVANEEFHKARNERLAREAAELAKEAAELAEKEKAAKAHKDMLVETIWRAFYSFIGSIAAVRACIYVSSLCH